MQLSDHLRSRLTDHTPGVGWVFLACCLCQRTVPHYRLYGKRVSGKCYCGHDRFRPVQIAEWKAALWLAWGWLSRRGEPRMPLREAPSKYA